MKVSVALTTYNGEPYLAEQLGSFVGQTRLPDELVVCDDGSVDRTMEILDSFARSAPFTVRLHRNTTRLGYSRNFERAIELCSGDIIFLSDQDDVWFPEKLEVVLQAFQSLERPLVVANDAELTDAHLKPAGVTVIRQTLSAGFSTDSFVVGCCTAFRAEFRALVLPVPHGHFVHDTWIHALGRALDCRVLLSQPLQYYRRHGSNTSQWFVNTTAPVTLFDRIRHYGPKDSHQPCVKRVAALEILRDRLRERGVELEALLGEGLELERALYRTEQELEAVRRRLALLERRRLSRLVPAWRMLRAGDYAFFSGWMSFIKDVLH